MVVDFDASMSRESYVGLMSFAKMHLGKLGESPIDIKLLFPKQNMDEDLKLSHILKKYWNSCLSLVTEF